MGPGGQESYLAKEMLHLEAAIIDFEGRRAGKAEEAVREGGKEIHQYLGHVAQSRVLLLEEGGHGPNAVSHGECPSFAGSDAYRIMALDRPSRHRSIIIAECCIETIET